MLKRRLQKIALDALVTTFGPPVAALKTTERKRACLLPPIRQAAFVDSIPRDGTVLEIGPFDRPKITGPNVHYFDLFDQAQLREIAVSVGRDPDGCPFIHHVSPSGDLRSIGAKFDAVFSSHVLEHQPDLVRHLKDVSDLLRPGGAYYLIIPDKRYCFDHFQSVTTLDEVGSARGNVLHTESSMSRYFLERTHNNQVLHWLGWHGRPVDDREGEASALERLRSGEYVDAHNWAFTPASFREIVMALKTETGLAPTAVHDTMFAELEFMAVLRKD